MNNPIFKLRGEKNDKKRLIEVLLIMISMINILIVQYIQRFELTLIGLLYLKILMFFILFAFFLNFIKNVKNHLLYEHKILIFITSIYLIYDLPIIVLKVVFFVPISIIYAFIKNLMLMSTLYIYFYIFWGINFSKYLNNFKFLAIKGMFSGMIFLFNLTACIIYELNNKVEFDYRIEDITKRGYNNFLYFFIIFLIVIIFILIVICIYNAYNYRNLNHKYKSLILFWMLYFYLIILYILESYFGSYTVHYFTDLFFDIFLNINLIYWLEFFSYQKTLKPINVDLKEIQNFNVNRNDTMELVSKDKTTNNKFIENWEQKDN